MKKKIPHARGLPFVGLLPKFLKDPRSYIQEVASQGDIVNVTLGGMKVTYIFHPQYVQHVLLKNHQNYIKGKLMERTKLVFGEGLLTREGDSWRKQRRNMAASFVPNMIEDFSDIVCNISYSFIDQMEGVRNVDSDCLALTLEIVLQSLFGASSTSNVDVISKSFDVISDFFASSSEFFIQFPIWIPTSRNRKFKTAFSDMDQVVSEIIQNRKSNEVRHDLLQRILDNSSDETEKIIRDEVRTLMLAGHETTSLSIVFSLWLLAEHPNIQDEIRKQILQITGKERVQPKHRKQLSAVENVIQEAIRIYPPAPIFVREPLEDDTLGEYHLPAKSIVIVPPFQIHHDERWYEKPTVFDPTRWNSQMTENLPKMAYIPFGGGPRICIGRHMAMMESTLILAEIIRSYGIEKIPSSTLNLIPSITLRPKGGVYLQFTRL